MVYVKCYKCGYVFKTKSKLLFISCSNCQRKIRKKKAIANYLCGEIE